MFVRNLRSVCHSRHAYISPAVKDALYKSQVEAFADTVEKHLSKESSAFLVGGSASAADIIVAILLAAAAARSGAQNIPEKATCLLETVLNNKAIVDAIGKMDIPQNKPEEISAPADKPEETSVPATSGAIDFSMNEVVKKLNEMSIAHNTYAHKLSVKVEELIENVPLAAGETHTKNVGFSRPSRQLLDSMSLQSLSTLRPSLERRFPSR